MNNDQDRGKSMWRKISAVAILLLVAACFLVIGIFWERQAADEYLRVELNSVQATLTYNRISSEKHMQAMLSQGCSAEVEKQVAIDEDQDTALLADIFKNGVAPWASQYVIVRDPKLVSSLPNFKSKFGKDYLTPVCRKASGNKNS